MVDLVVFAALGWERRAMGAGLTGLRPGSRARTWEGSLADGAQALLVQTGIGQDAARRAAFAAPSTRCAFVVCGCAGALDPTLTTGTIVTADEVIALDAELGAAERFQTARPARASSSARSGAVASANRLLASIDDKRRAARTGALVVDMESASIAQEARTRGIPAVVIRVVLDRADQAIDVPPTSIDPTTGELRVGAALAAALPPTRWPALVRLGWQTERAARRLRQAAQAVLGPGIDALLDVRTTAT